MVRIQPRLLILALVCLPLLLFASSNGPIYFPDDPIQKMPPPSPVDKAFVHQLSQGFDFFRNSLHWKTPPPVPAGGVNTLGEPPDSAWFTNRHALHRLTREQLQRGPAQGEGPTPPFTVVGGKTEGITPGFRMQDAAGRLYFVKADVRSSPELATSVDAIVSRFLYAIGYNVPENDIVLVKLKEFTVSDKAETTDANGKKRKMTWED